MLTENWHDLLLLWGPALTQRAVLTPSSHSAASPPWPGYQMFGCSRKLRSGGLYQCPAFCSPSLKSSKRRGFNANINWAGRLFFVDVRLSPLALWISEARVWKLTWNGHSKEKIVATQSCSDSEVTIHHSVTSVKKQRHKLFFPNSSASCKHSSHTTPLSLNIFLTKETPARKISLLAISRICRESYLDIPSSVRVSKQNRVAQGWCKSCTT